jgi:hypothetical protein
MREVLADVNCDLRATLHLRLQHMLDLLDYIKRFQAVIISDTRQKAAKFDTRRMWEFESAMLSNYGKL